MTSPLLRIRAFVAFKTPYSEKFADRESSGIFLAIFPQKNISMKQLFTLLLTTLSVATFAQGEVKVSEENYTFSVGAKNSIIVTVPYGKLDIVEKELKNELKEWGGKFNSSKGEYVVSQGTIKAMGAKPFDGYARAFVSGEVVKVAVAIDLGGAYLSSNAHGAQFTAMKERLKEFAVRAAKECVAEELKAEQKILDGFMKDQKDLEKDKENLLKSIDDYKKKIAEAEKKIEENTTNQSKKKEEITRQTEKVAEVDKKKNIK